MSKKFLITKPHLLKGVEEYTKHTQIVDYAILKSSAVALRNREEFECITKDDIKDHDLGLENLMSDVNFKTIESCKFLRLGSVGSIITYKSGISVFHTTISDCEHISLFKELVEKSIDITENDKITHYNLIKNKIPKVILEGCDYAGKTTLSKKLAEIGVFAQERDLENFSFWIRDYFELTAINKIVRNRIKNNKEKYIVLTLSEEVLKHRKNIRKETESKFDVLAEKSNEIYKVLDLDGLKNVIKINIEDINKDAFLELVINGILDTKWNFKKQ